LAHIGVGRKPADLAEDRLLVRLRDRDPAFLGRECEGGAEVRTEIEVRAGHREKERRLQHRREPLTTDNGVPEDTREVRIERAEVEQRLVDVEDQYTVALRSHLRRGRDSTPRAFRLPAFQAGALGHYATSPAVNYGSDDVRRR